VLTNILLLLVAALHIYFLFLEMFLWTKPLGLKTFAMNSAQAKDRAVLAANQGLYNGFLAAGLIWAVIHPDATVGHQLAIFFCSCVIVAALYGAYSVSHRIFFIQGLPAIAALAALWWT
jgi:putative membrane protein